MIDGASSEFVMDGIACWREHEIVSGHISGGNDVLHTVAWILAENKQATLINRWIFIGFD